MKIGNINKQNTAALIWFALLTLCIMYPLYRSGFVLTLDMVFTPQMYPSGNLNLLNLHEYILHLLATIIPGELLQKIILTLIFFLTGYLGYNLLKMITKNFCASIIAGSLYLINPFVYDRFLAGQWIFLLGYALTPLFLAQLINIGLEKNDPWYKSPELWAVVLWCTIGILSKHHFLLWWIIYVIHLLVEILTVIIQSRSTANILARLKVNGHIIAKIFFSSIGLILIFIFSSKLPFTSEELLYFATNPGQNGVIFNLITFNGFWAEGTTFKHIFELATLSEILLSLLILINFAVLPFAILDKNTRKYAKVLALSVLLGCLGLALSIGQNGLIGDIYAFLMDELPLLRGMREPQKFLSLYLIGFSMVLGVNIDYLYKLFSQNFSKFIPIILLLFLIIYPSFGLFSGGNHQLKSVTYPSDFAEVDEILRNLKSPKILVLPWTAYINTTWNNQRFANPSKLYFDQNIHVSENYLKGECDINYNEEEKTICVNYDDSSDFLLNSINSLKFTHILVYETNLKNASSSLTSSRNYQLVFQGEYLTLLEINNY